MTQEATRASYGGKGRVFVVRAAERLREEAQNAFLKLLEEAPPHVRIILLVTRLEQVLPTVRSRTFHVRFSPLGRDDWVEVFRRLSAVEVDVAQRLFWLSGGSLLRAMALLGEEEHLHRLPRSLFALDGPVGSWAAEVFEALGPRLERDDLDRLLDAATVWIRDMLVWRLTGDTRLLTTPEATAPAIVAKEADPQQLMVLLGEVDALRQASRLNLDPRLVCHRLEALVRRACARNRP